MAKLTKELIRMCQDKHLKIVYLRNGVTELGTLYLDDKHTASYAGSIAFDDALYGLNGETAPASIQYTVVNAGDDGFPTKNLMAPGTPDDVIAFIKAYQPAPLTNEIIQMCHAKQLEITRHDQKITQWGHLNLDKVDPDSGPVDFNDVDASFSDETLPETSRYSVVKVKNSKDGQSNKELMAPGTPSDVVTFIKNY